MKIVVRERSRTRFLHHTSTLNFLDDYSQEKNYGNEKGIVEERLEQEGS
jgi:hypothetical protein